MTKILNLVYNPIQNVFYFFEGDSDNPRNRKEYKKEDLISCLKKEINFDRKSILHLTAISGDVYQELHRMLKGSKVSLGLEEDVGD